MMTEYSEDLKDSLPTERKYVWRTAEERRMSDLKWVLEWLERRQGKKKQALQVCIYCQRKPARKASFETTTV